MNINNDIFTENNELTDSLNAYIAIKVKFFAQDRKIYGFLLLFYPPGGDYCEKSFLTLTTYSLGYNSLGANSSFKEFFDAIYNKAKEGMSFQNINFKLRATLESDFSIIETNAKIPKLKDVLEIEQELKSLFRKAMSDKKITIFTFIENILPDHYNDFFEKTPHADTTHKKAKPASNTSLDYEVDIPAEVNIPPDTKLVPVNLILAPVDGKSIFDLSQGDQIAVTIPSAGDSDPSAAAQELPNRQKKAKELVQDVHVTGNFYYEGTYYIGIQIDNKNYAMVAEEANIKIKLSQVHQEKSYEQKKRYAVTANKRSRVIVIMYICVFIVLIAVLFFSFTWLL